MKGGKKTRRITGLEKLTDANNAGTVKSKQCTLILTEGDSAKTLAIAGLSVVGHDNYGVFPLRGKLLNVRTARSQKIMKNEEVTAIIKILGLKFNTEYTDVKQLRYGKLMIMADQDHDGSHIKGLVINLIHHFWPSLMKIDNFLQEFITPIIKATRRKKQISFFNVPEFLSWSEDKNITNWDIKYYKGLGTSSVEEVREYFSNLRVHKKKFSYLDEDNRSLDIAFGEKNADERKLWMNNCRDGTYLDTNSKSVSIRDFVDKELVLYSIENCKRSIPHAIDGMKPGKRKILFCCFKRNLDKDIKVSQLSGYVSEKSAYHHGEESLQKTIISMAQNYVGSNNINLLHPQGQFGSRLEGGKDAAKARYIHTRLSGLTRKIFHPDDDAILEYIYEENKKIEPKFYVPIVPLILINGEKGIGTGWSSNVPSFNPIDIVKNIKRLMDGEEMIPMKPFYRGFKGEIKWIKAAKKYRSYGIIKRKGTNKLEISELPIGKWSQNFKKYLENMLPGAPKKVGKKIETISKKEALITEFKDYNTDSRVLFELTCPKLLQKTDEEIFKILKLSAPINLSNMTLYNIEDMIHQFPDPESIIHHFYDVRLSYYAQRKEYQLGKLYEQRKKLTNQARFILGVVNKEIKINNRKKLDIENTLDSMDFDRINENYDYLLRMKIWNLTKEKIDKLKKKIGDIEYDIRELEETHPTILWKRDLDDFVRSWICFHDQMNDFEENPKGKRGRKVEMPTGHYKKNQLESVAGFDDIDLSMDMSVRMQGELISKTRDENMRPVPVDVPKTTEPTSRKRKLPGSEAVEEEVELDSRPTKKRAVEVRKPKNFNINGCTPSSLMKYKKTELLEIAQERLISVPKSWTKGKIVDKIMVWVKENDVHMKFSASSSSIDEMDIDDTSGIFISISSSDEESIDQIEEFSSTE
eukprot:TRINITY_DN1808_c0_g1_i1.p1 TRINITY_DN1808_c0_g1~~TRINITY_DN1808_c0_g1_i1.p1  ORF type:complete len:940 (+),score=205.40 TRINITY_DN1808_c0_g1_i1:57-2822(+)